MKYILCAGWSICQRVHFPFLNAAGRLACLQAPHPFRSWALPALLLPYSVPLEQPHGVLALGVEAVLLLPPHPCPQGHSARQGDRSQGHENTPLLPSHLVPEGARGSQPAGQGEGFQLCALWQIFGVCWDQLRAVLPRCRAFRLCQMKTYPQVLISGFALPKC